MVCWWIIHFGAYELENFTNPQDGYPRLLNRYGPHTNWKNFLKQNMIIMGLHSFKLTFHCFLNLGVYPIGTFNLPKVSRKKGRSFLGITQGVISMAVSPILVGRGYNHIVGWIPHAWRSCRTFFVSFSPSNVSKTLIAIFFSQCIKSNVCHINKSYKFTKMFITKDHCHRLTSSLKRNEERLR
jgi:hypothetical protein